MLRGQLSLGKFVMDMLCWGQVCYGPDVLGQACYKGQLSRDKFAIGQIVMGGGG